MEAELFVVPPYLQFQGTSRVLLSSIEGSARGGHTGLKIIVDSLITHLINAYKILIAPCLECFLIEH